MTERSSSGQENASFYARGVTEGLAGQLLENKAHWRSSTFSVRTA
jgi:hypothetical protein